MSSPNHVKNIIIVGGTGNIGTPILSSLLSHPASFNLTILSRSPPPTPPQNYTHLSGSYTSPPLLATAFRGQDVAIFTLHFSAMELQKELIKAAVREGVKWIFPTEWAGDGLNREMVGAVPLFWPKREARELVEGLAKEQQEGGLEEEERVRWVGVCTGPWVGASLQRGLFGFDVAKKTAKLYSDGGRFNTSTLARVGETVAAMLALPIENPAEPRKSLGYYADNFVYTSSFHLTQADLLASLRRVTDTEWSVEEASIADWIAQGREAFAKGNFMAGAGLTFAFYMGEGRGGDVEAKAREDREVLSLAEAGEDLDEVVRRVVGEGGRGGVF